MLRVPRRPWGVVLTVAALAVLLAPSRGPRRGLAMGGGKPFLNEQGEFSHVMIANGLEDVPFGDDKAIRAEVARLMDDEALRFWRRCCQDKGRPLDFRIVQTWCSEHDGIPITFHIWVQIPAATCQKLLEASAEGRAAVIDQPGAVSVTQMPGRF